MNERQRRFCEEYLVDMCAQRAALRAGYSKSTAEHCAAGWIKRQNPEKPELRAEIDRLMIQRSRRTKLSAERVVRELAGIAFDGGAGAAEPKAEGVVRELADIAFEDDAEAAELKAEDPLRETAVAAPAEEGEAPEAEEKSAPVERSAGRRTAKSAAARKPAARKRAAEGVRTQDRLRALELLGKHLGVFTESVQIQQVQPVIVDETGSVEEGGGDFDGGAEA